jgi:23S rRNA (guanine745-N1)-methyltransferase
MLAARRRFLDRGHYAPIADTVRGFIVEHLNRSRPTRIASPVILDVGCGEGYYLAYLAAGFSAGELVTCRYAGLDSSKEAIRMAVRRLPELCGVVADVWQAIPVRTAACHVLLNIFAPRNVDEFARVLQPGGLLLVVIPAPEYLESLRTLVPLIGVEEQKASHLLTDLARHAFRHTATHPLTFTIHLNGDEAADLVAMSPSFRHLEPTDLDRVRAAGSVLTEARVLILAFQRMGTG